jgi:Ca2+-binding RTX toxin-like protein
VHPSTRPGRGAARAAVGVTAVSLAVVGLPAVASAAPSEPYTSELHYDDALDGGNGDDTLVGGPGQDALEQGRGGGTRQLEGPES